MAGKTNGKYEIDIVIKDQGTAQAQKALTAMDKMMQGVQNRANALGKTKAQPTISLKDNVSGTLDKITSKFKSIVTIASGAAITNIGLKMASGLGRAVDQAGQLLTTLETIRSASGATNAQLAAIQKTAMRTSSTTKFTIPQTTQFAAQLATAGLNANQVNSLLPIFTKYAEVQAYGKGTDPTEAIKGAIEMAHGMGKYKPQELDTFLNQFNKATFLQPEDTQSFSETVKYLMGTGQMLNMSDSDVLYMAALSNRMGLAGSMGGTSAADMLIRTIPGLFGGSATKDPKSLKSMKQLGLVDANGQSKFFNSQGQITDLAGFIDTLYTSTANLNPEQRLTAFHNIFGQQGMRAAALFGSDKGMEQLAALHEGMGRVSNINAMQEAYLKTPEGQMNQLRSNLDNLKFQVFLEMAKALNPLLTKLNSFIGDILDLSDKHPKIAQYVGTFALIATSVMLVVGPLMSLVGAIGMIGTGIEALGGIAAIAAPVILPLAAANFLGGMGGIGNIQQYVDGIGNALDTAKRYISTHFTNNPEFQKAPDLTSKVIFVVDDLLNTFNTWLAGGGQTQIDNIGSKMGEALGKALETAEPAMISVAITVGKAVGEALLSAVKGVIVSGVYDPNSTHDQQGFAKNLFGGTWDNIKTAFKYLNPDADPGDPNAVMQAINKAVTPKGPIYGPPVPSTPTHGPIAMHANGGIFSKPHFGLVAEAGPEAIVPLANRNRGTAVLQQAANALGVSTGGGSVGSLVVRIDGMEVNLLADTDEVALAVGHKLLAGIQQAYENRG